MRRNKHETQKISNSQHGKRKHVYKKENISNSKFVKAEISPFFGHSKLIYNPYTIKLKTCTSAEYFYLKTGLFEDAGEKVTTVTFRSL